MPQLKNKNSITLQHISIFLFLALMCCNQLFQFSHLHHFHEDDTLAFDVSYHPLDLVVEHSSAHQHGEERSSHPDDNRHNYENQADCNITRSQSAHTVACSEPSIFFSIVYLPPEGFEESISYHQEPSSTQEEYSSFSIIRGPPLFG
jgi:hypothetical protein